MITWSLFGYYYGTDPLAEALADRLLSLAALRGMLKEHVAKNGRAARHSGSVARRTGQCASEYG